MMTAGTLNQQDDMNEKGNKRDFKQISASADFKPRYADADREQLTDRLNTVDQHAAALYQSVNRTGEATPPGIVEYVATLSVALEELRAAEEELCQQNEELQRARHALELEQHRYRDLFEFAPDGYIVTDQNGKIQEANRAASELLGVESRYLTNKVLVTFVPEEQRRAFRALLLNLQTIDRIQEWEITFQQRGGERFEASLTVATVHDEKGNTAWIRWIVRDITQRKRIEEQLREIQLQNLELIESDRLKEQFIATMSHELRTPLTAILGFSNLLMRQFHKHFNSQHLGLIERIFKNGRHLLALIEDILDFSKLRANQVELQLEAFDLVELILSSVEEFRSLAERKNLKLDVELYQSNLTVINDRARMRQILVNLISNAIKFTDTGSVMVQIRSPRRDRISIAVQDTGIGIAETDLGSIFQEFRQVNQTTTRRHGGTGLGLAITQALTRLMSGKISVQSELGMGSTFLLEVPCRVSPQADSAFRQLVDTDRDRPGLQ